MVQFEKEGSQTIHCSHPKGNIKKKFPVISANRKNKKK